MRFVRAVELEGFRGYERRHAVALNHVTIFAGPNNAGKSAFLVALRRLAAVTTTESPGTWHDVSYRGFQEATVRVRLACQDMLTLALKRHVEGPLLMDAESVDKLESSIRDGHRHPVVQVKPSRNDKITVTPADLEWLRVLARLPVVLLPDNRQPNWPVTSPETERRKRVRRPAAPQRPTSDPQGRAPHRTAAEVDGLRENVIDANLVFPTLRTWRWHGPRWTAFQLHAEALLGRKVVLPRDLDEHGPVVYLGNGVPAMSYRVDSLGAGVIEQLTVAFALASHDGGLLLYEEPEQHVHPHLQRLTMRHLLKLSREGNWQVVVTTHSNHILDMDKREGVSILLVNEAPYMGQRLRRAPIHGVLDALGVRASSLNEPNALIWVEGPSDAIYLRHFLGTAHPDLQEHRDYTFGFLGGSLLKHASAAVDPAALVDSLVALFRVHPGSCIVIDSDRDAADGPLGKPYAARFVEDARAHGWGERIWITEGREMENYLSDGVLREVGRCAQPLPEHSDGAFVKSLDRVKAAGGSDRGGKVEFATAAVAYVKAHADWLRLPGLHGQVDRLAEFIRTRCGRPAAAG